METVEKSDECKMVEEDIQKYLIQGQLRLPKGGGYIALIIGIGNVVWAIYDYIVLKSSGNKSEK